MDDGDVLVTTCDLCPVFTDGNYTKDQECRHTIIPDPNPDRLNLCEQHYGEMHGTAGWPDDDGDVDRKYAEKKDGWDRD